MGSVESCHRKGSIRRTNLLSAITILMDTRQQRKPKFRQFLQNAGSVVSNRRLQVGDIVFSATCLETDQNVVLSPLIEIKTIPDLFQSLANGRLKRQLFNMNSCAPLSKLLIIEGDVCSIAKSKQQYLFKMVEHLKARNGLKIVYCRNVCETLQCIKGHKLDLESSCTNIVISFDILEQYGGTTDRQGGCCAQILQTIRGIGPVLSKSIAFQFQTFGTLISYIYEMENSGNVGERLVRIARRSNSGMPDKELDGIVDGTQCSITEGDEFTRQLQKIPSIGYVAANKIVDEYRRQWACGKRFANKMESTMNERYRVDHCVCLQNKLHKLKTSSHEN